MRLLPILIMLLWPTLAIAQTRTAPHMAIACKDMAVLMRIAMMSEKNDYASFRAYSSDMIDSGECKVVQKGQRVTVERTEGPASCLKLGSGTCYWSPMKW